MLARSTIVCVYVYVCQKCCQYKRRNIGLFCVSLQHMCNCNTQHTSCNTQLQHTTHLLQHPTHLHGDVLCDITQIKKKLRQKHNATHCNTRQHTAVHCNTMQHTAAHCSTLQHTAVHYSTLQHTKAHCNTLRHTATHNIAIREDTVHTPCDSDNTRLYHHTSLHTCL